MIINMVATIGVGVTVGSISRSVGVGIFRAVNFINGDKVGNTGGRGHGEGSKEILNGKIKFSFKC